MERSPFAWSVLVAALCVRCGGNATDETRQLDPTAPPSDAGDGRARGSGAGGSAGGSASGGQGGSWSGEASGGQAGSSSSEAGGTAVAEGGTGATASGGSASGEGTGGATAEEALDGSVTPTCQNQPIRHGASCRGLNLSCGAGCYICTCQALPSGGAAWKCTALVC